MTLYIEFARLFLDVCIIGFNILIVVLFYKTVNRWAPELLAAISLAISSFAVLGEKIDRTTSAKDGQ